MKSRRAGKKEGEKKTATAESRERSVSVERMKGTKGGEGFARGLESQELGT